MTLLRIVCVCVVFVVAAVQQQGMAAEESVAGGTPLPAGKHTFVFPSSEKQTITFTSNGTEVIQGVVKFSGEKPIGKLVLDTKKGKGKGAIAIEAKDLRTGKSGRDKKMMNPNWLDGKNNPQIAFNNVTFTKVEDTVYQLEGTWHMRGKEKKLSVPANIRLVPEVKDIGKNLVRVKAEFELALADFDIQDKNIGGKIAPIWEIKVVLLGLPQ